MVGAKFSNPRMQQLHGLQWQRVHGSSDWCHCTHVTWRQQFSLDVGVIGWVSSCHCLWNVGVLLLCANTYYVVYVDILTHVVNFVIFLLQAW